MTAADRATGRDDDTRGQTLIRLAMAGTVVFAVLSAVGVVWTSTTGPVVAAVAVALFAVGCGTFVWAFLVAAGRSRHEAISVTSIYFLSDSAPGPVRRLLLGALAAQVAISLLAASLRPFTALAFGILAPMYGLGMCGLWAARHGHFPSRHAD